MLRRHAAGLATSVANGSVESSHSVSGRRKGCNALVLSQLEDQPTSPPGARGFVPAIRRAAGAVAGGLLSASGFWASVTAAGGKRGNDRQDPDRPDSKGTDKRHTQDQDRDDRREQSAARDRENADHRQSPAGGNDGDGGGPKRSADDHTDNPADRDPDTVQRSAAFTTRETNAQDGGGDLGGGLRQNVLDLVDRLRDNVPGQGVGGANRDGGGDDDRLVVDTDPNTGTLAVDTSSISFRSDPDGMSVETSNISFSSDAPARTPEPDDGPGFVS